MKILNFYLLREFAPSYIGSMAFFTVLLLLERVMSFVRLVAKGYATIIDFFVLLFFSVPPTLAITMPMATIMGSLVAVGRLSNDSEITAIRAGGIRLNSVFISLYIAGIIIGAMSFYLTDALVPIGNIKFRTLYQRITIARPDLQIDVHSINQIANDVTLLVDEVDGKTGDLINVTIFQGKRKGYTKTITSEKGYFISKDVSNQYITLRLKNGMIIDPEDKNIKKFSSTIFKVLDLNLYIESREIKNIVKTPREMSLKEIRENMKQTKKGAREYNIYLVEYNKKIAIPFACILFIFLGTPFAVTRGRSGKGLGLGIGVLIIFIYYIFLLTFERLGKNGVVQPALAMWIPNILFFIAGVINLIKRGKI